MYDHQLANKAYFSNITVKIISESFYPQDGGESQLASKLRHCHSIFSHIRKRDIPGVGGAENASTGKRKYGKGKYETAHFARMENACTENASTNLQGWKTQVRKIQVQCKPSVR